MNRMGERVRFNKGLFAWMGFRSIGVPFRVCPRARQDWRRWRLARQLLRFGLDGHRLVHDHPAAGVVLLGLVISLLRLLLCDGAS